MKKLFIISFAVFLSACSAKLLVPTQADADRGTTKYPGVTLAQLNDGKKLYEDNCGKCHPYKSLPSHSEEEWGTVVPKMVKKVNKKAGTEVLDGAKEALILKYVLVMRDANNK